jgi:ribonucleoside-diphosphate reductase alpha chain
VQTSQETSVKSGSEFAAVPKVSALAPSSSSTVATIADYKIIRRNGAVVGFEPSKISIAMTKAFLAVNGGQGAASARVRELVEQLTVGVVSALMRRQPAGGTFHIEDVQDQVELALMRSGEHDVARAYVLYRAKRQEEPSSRPPRARSSRRMHCILWWMGSAYRLIRTSSRP